MTEKRVKDHQTHFRSTKRFHEAVVEAARRDSRSVNSLIEKLLRDYMRSVGIDPDKPPPPRDP